MGQSAEELRRDIADTREELSGTIDAIGDRMSPGRMIERRKNRVVQGAQSIRDRVMGTAHDAREGVSSTAGEAVGAVKDMPDTVKQRTAGAPMMAGAIAFGAGFLVAVAMPPSRTEKKATATLLERAEPLQEQLTQAGHEVAEHLKEPAQQAATAIKDAASEGAHGVVDSAKSAAQDTKERADDSVNAVRNTAS